MKKKILLVFAALILLGALWIVNMIWFRPLNIRRVLLINNLIQEQIMEVITTEF